MKKVLSVVLCLVIAASLLGACGPAGVKDTKAPGSPATTGAIKIGIVNLHPSESGYREANVKDMEKVFSSAKGYDVKTANYNALDEQLNAAKDFITQGVKYLLISAAAQDGWDNVLQEAKQAGITVFLFDRMINCDESLYAAAVVSDMNNQGDTAVAWLKAQNLDAYNIIHIQGQLGSAAQEGRTAALQREVDAGTMNLVRRGTGGDTWSGDEAKKIVEAAISAGEDFNIIYAENDGMADGATKALDEAGITYGTNGKVIIMGFDCNKFALRNVLSGKWNYDGQCSPFQADVIDGLIKGMEAGTAYSGPKQIISDEKGFDALGVGAIKVTQEIIDQYGLGE